MRVSQKDFDNLCKNLAGFLTLFCGVSNISSVIGPVEEIDLIYLEKFFSLGFIQFSKSATLVIGFALIISAINIFKQKKTAFQVVFALAFLSVVFHITKNLDFVSVIPPLVLLALLFYLKDHFVVKSSIDNVKDAGLKSAVLLLGSIAYGSFGFWLLEQGDLGFDFSLLESVYYTLRYLAFMDALQLVPANAYAAWFVSSLNMLGALIIVYFLQGVYRPVQIKKETENYKRMIARKILDQHGSNALDFFKLWDDKSYFFSGSLNSFVAYAHSANSIIVLGDPVGPKNEVETMINAMKEFSYEHDLQLCFFQTSSNHLDSYYQNGFKKLKIGDEALIDLENFNLEGAKKKDFRNRIRKLEKLGYGVKYYEPDIDDEILDKLEIISDEWLEGGHKERGFSLGYFDREYIRQSELMTVEDANGSIVAFVNKTPSFKEKEIGIDLMRKSKDAPSGVMDYIFVKFIMEMKDRGYKSLNIGLAPMSGFEPHEKASFEELAVHSIFQRLNFLFNYIGLKTFKSKFADEWEPKYLIFEKPQHLPKLAMAINDVLQSVDQP